MIKILSLFDGLSCAQIALDKLRINDYIYYASEIDKYAIAVTQYNYPHTIQLGDITKLKGSEIKDIDLLIGGSPCQDLSIAKKNREGLNGKRSGLFWEYVRILKETNPKYFILENVNSMPKEDKEIINKTLGIEPIMINASLISAQQRKRLFWTNIQRIAQPEDKYIFLKDIIEKKATEKYLISNKHLEAMKKCNKNFKIRNPLAKSTTLTSTYYKIPCDGNYLQQKNRGNIFVRKLTPIECEKLQTIPDNYTSFGKFDGEVKEISDTQRYKMLGNSFCCDVIVHILSYLKEV